MNILPPYMSIYNQILQDLEKAMPFLKVPKANAGRKPKLTDTQIAAMFILSYITGMKVLKLAQLLFDPSIQSWHIFRKYRLKRVYRILREYQLYMLRLLILSKLLLGKKIELVVDGTIVDAANVNRARTQKIKRLWGVVWWVKRRRKIKRRDNGKVVEFEEVRYGMLMMVLCDRDGVVYDVWITFGSMHEVRAFRERKKRSVWFRELVENCEVYGDRGYRGCEGVVVCNSRELRKKRQVVEGVISQMKLFNAGSGWRTLTCVLVYVYAYAIGYSFYRRFVP
ncbi:MAG: hypothetical protein ACK4LT_07835 [Aquificaceae bacterium]